MDAEFLLAIFAAATLCVVFHGAAGLIYDLHYRLKQGGGKLSKLLTADVKHLEDKERWVRRYRAKVLFIMAVILAIPIYRYFNG